MPISRSRSICFTINNYCEDILSNLRTVSSTVRFMVFQCEQGESGTPHIQGYCVADNARTLGSWKRVVGDRAHIEFARGTADQNEEYCSKDETRIPGTVAEFFGSKPTQGARSDLGAVAVRVREGAKMADVAVEFPADFVRYSNGIARLVTLFGPGRTEKTQIFWYFGPT